MRKILAVLIMVVANVAIPTISSAATITLDILLGADEYESATGGVVSLRINGTWVRYDVPYQNCGANFGTDRNGVIVGESTIECNDVELVNGNLFTSADSTTVTVTVPGEETNTGCDLTQEEALQIWLSYFFLSWGILIPIFIAALAVGAIAKTIRGNR